MTASTAISTAPPITVSAPYDRAVALAAVVLSGEPALTDEDILGFLLTPAGFAAELMATGFRATRWCRRTRS